MSVTGVREVSLQDHGEAGRLLDKVVNRLKATPFIWKGEGNKEEDPFRISWADQDKAIEQFCLFAKKELYPLLGPPCKVGPRATYKEAAFLDVLMYMVAHGVTSENGTKGFRKEYGKCPSGRTLRYRLGKLEFSEVESAFLKANQKILSYFRKKRKFKRVLSLFKKGKNYFILIQFYFRRDQGRDSGVGI